MSIASLSRSLSPTTERNTRSAFWQGSTENVAVCQSMLSNLRSRGLRADRSQLVLVDSLKALRKAVRETFADATLVQSCQIHQIRNVLDHLP